MQAGRIADAVVETKRKGFRSRRTFGVEAWSEYLELVASAGSPATIVDAFRAGRQAPERLVALRHDVDHDVETAVAFGRLEAEVGHKSTYYLLHTDWYYRADGSSGLSTQVLQAADELASLGHEIALHNNAITPALQTGEDPVELLARELEALRGHGFDVVGTVAHGDPLCRKVGYVNSEVFTECPRPALGAPDRELRLEPGATAVRLRPVPMADLGLEYEAGFIGHDLYLSDTGGRWSRPLDEIREALPSKRMLQVLTHPVWWAFDGEPVRPREARTAPIVLDRPPGSEVEA